MTASLLVWWQGQCRLEKLDERSLSRTFGSGNEDAVEVLVSVDVSEISGLEDILEGFWLLAATHSTRGVHAS